MAAAAVLAILSDGLAAQEAPKPRKEHEWLQQLVGEWETEGEALVEPGKPPVKTKGSESGRSLGAFWVVLENKAEFMGTPFTGILSLGFNPEAGKFVGTWIDSMTSTLWTYQGTLDASGKILTLETEGPSPGDPGKKSRYREVIEVKEKDHKVLASSVEKDGAWTTFVTMHYRRKK
jgi:hypothetical protein